MSTTTRQSALIAREKGHTTLVIEQRDLIKDRRPVSVKKQIKPTKSIVDFLKS